MSSRRIKGYRKKPWWIYLIAVGYATVPVVTLVHFGLVTGFSTPVLKEVATSRYFLAEAAAALSGAFAVLIVSRASMIYFVSLSFCTVGLKLYEWHNQTLLGTPFDAIMVAFWLAVGIVFVTSELRTPYLNPRARWWQQAQRIRSVSHSALEYRGIQYPIVTINLSTGGAFVKLDERLFPELSTEVGEEGSAMPDRRKAEPAGNLLLTPEQVADASDHLSLFPRELGTAVRLRIQTLPDVSNNIPGSIYESDAEVVWMSAPAGDYRFGLGLRFVGRTPFEKRQLQGYLQELEKLGFEGRDSKP